MRTDHIHMVNIDDASRTHKEKDDVDEDARPSGRTDGRGRLSGSVVSIKH